jgi:hypothetical protein
MRSTLNLFPFMLRSALLYTGGCGLILSSSLLAPAMYAQSNQGALAGSIVDASGAAVPNANITATNPATGQSISTVSSSSGDYRFPSLQVGTYSVRVSASGFRTIVQNGVAVQIQNTTALNITVSVGSQNESVVVSANAVQLQTESSDVSTVVTPKQVEDLPLSTNGSAIRNAQDFVFLTPATYGTGTSGGTFEGGVSGGQAFGSEILFDGASLQVQSFGDGFANEILPSVDAIDEFNVLVGGIPAQYGRTSGGIQSYNTKAGTNQYHGTAFEIFRNTVLDANNWFNDRDIALNGRNSGNDTPQDKKNEYGGSFGGPIVIPHLYNGHDKSFFFFTWEQFRQHKGYSNFITLPTLANLNGDFSQNLVTGTVLGTNPCSGATVYQGEIFDPATTRTVALPKGGTTQCRDPFMFNGQLNVIDPSRLSTVAKNVTTFLPATRINNALDNNYLQAGVFPIIDTTYTVRVDQSFGAVDKVFASYSTRENVQNNLAGNLPLPSNAAQTFQDLPTHIIRVGYDHIFSPTVLNHFLVGITRVLNHEGYLNSLGTTDYSSKVGLPGGSGPLFPGFSLGEGPTISLGDIQGNAGYNSRISDNAGYLGDTLSISKGRHNLSIGGEYRYLLSISGYLSPLAGNFYFGRAQTASDQGNTANSGNGVASFLLGQPNYATASRDLVSTRNLGQYAGIYVEDQYKATKSLNLSLGVRYNVDVPMREEHDFSSQFSPTALNPGAGNLPGSLIFAGNGAGRSGVSSRYANVYYKNVEPRVGFAWAPAYLQNKTVVQGTFSILNSALLEWTQIYNGIPAGYSNTAQVNNNASSGFGAAENLDTAGTPVPAFGINYDPTQLNTNSIPWNQRGFGRPGHDLTWSASVQQELAPDLILTLSYLGERGTHLPSNLLYVDDLNPKYFALGNALNQSIGANTVGVASPYASFTGSVAQALRPYPQYTFINTAAYGEDRGQQTYHAMTAKLQRRLHNGLNLLASYTWSKNITDTGNIIGGSLGGAYTASIQNPFNLKAEKAISPEDVPQLFVVSYIYELPFGKNKAFLSHSNLANYLAGGWSIGGIQRYQSGQPLGFGCATGIPGFSNCIRYNLTGQAIHSAARQSGKFNPTYDKWYNPAAFSDPNNATAIDGGAAYSFGDKPQYQGDDRSFNYYEEDFSFIKRTPIREGIDLQFRAELFNAFNRVIFGGPDGSPSDGANFGVVNGLNNSPRQGQLTLRLEF